MGSKSEEQNEDVPSEKIKLIQETQCRICLEQCSDSSLSLDAPMTEGENSKPHLVVFEALELLIKEKVIRRPKYPDKICKKCFGCLEIAYELITQYQLSKESILEQLEEFEEELVENEEKKDLPSNETDSKNSVEILIGTEKYSIQDLFIVEDSDDSEESGRFDGFLRNLGTTISADFVKKEERKPKIDLETPTFDIKKLKQENHCDVQDFEPTLVDEDIVLPNNTNLLSTGSRFEQHIISSVKKKSDKKGSKCKICGEVFTWSGSLHYHLKKHDDKQYNCKECDKKFLTSAQARRHNLEIHNKERTVEMCPICGKRFHYRSGLYYHLKMHNNIRDLHCSYCPKKYYTRTAIKRHEMTHTGERPFPCKYCPKKFCSSGERKKHYLYHTGDRPYPCKYCESSFSTLYNLKLHMTTHSGKSACMHCNKTFADGDILEFHVRLKHKRSEEEEVVFEKNGQMEQTMSESSDQWFDDADEIEPNNYYVLE